MGNAAPVLRIDYATYLALERDSDQKHEWLDGQVYAMAGGSIAHGQLATQAIIEISRLATACGCRVFGSDVKVRVRATGLATYPDGSVVCGAIERDPEDSNAITNPSVLVEVLSDSTERYDRGEKFHHYRHLDSLKNYVLVSQHEPRVEVFTRSAHGRWELTVAEAGQTFALSALEGSIAVDQVYADVELTPREGRT
jgi:Uma2 family endonuclease